MSNATHTSEEVYYSKIQGKNWVSIYSNVMTIAMMFLVMGISLSSLNPMKARHFSEKMLHWMH